MDIQFESDRHDEIMADIQQRIQARRKALELPDDLEALELIYEKMNLICTWNAQLAKSPNKRRPKTITDEDIAYYEKHGYRFARVIHKKQRVRPALAKFWRIARPRIEGIIIGAIATVLGMLLYQALVQ
jgi:hypothetical protein